MWLACWTSKLTNCRRFRHRCAIRFPCAIRARQTGRCLESPSLYPPLAALRRFPTGLQRTLEFMEGKELPGVACLLDK